MALEKKTIKILAGVGVFVLVGIVVGVTVGVVVGRRKSESVSIDQRVSDILSENPLIDGHNDLPWLFRSKFHNQINNLDLYNMTQYKATVLNATPTHTDIIRLREGHVGGQFWSIYTSCEHQGKDAAVSFLEQVDVTNRFIDRYPDVFRKATTAQEVRDAFNNKRIASLFGIEGGQAIESSFSLLRLFYQLGVRYITLTHNCNNPWADENRVDANPTWLNNNGLTDFGKRIIKEMNRLGMLVDLSHVSKQTMISVLSVTKSPIIYSHSSAYAVCNHTRNVPDDVLKLVEKNRGVVMVTFVPSFISCNSSDPGSIAQVAKHINHIKSVASIDNVGIGGDYDGISQTIPGLDDVSTYPKLIEYLMINDGWTEQEIIKLIGGNILRVLEENEKIAKDLQKTTQPEEGLIGRDDLVKHNLTTCRHLDMYGN